MSSMYRGELRLPHQITEISWILCDEHGCPGEAAPERERCFQHLTEEQREEYLSQVAAGQVNFTLAGLRVSASLFAEIMAAMPVTRDNMANQDFPVFPVPVRLDECVFTGHIDAQHVTFRSSCSMIKAVFEDGVKLNSVQCGASLDMRGATINGSASLDNASIEGDARLAGLKTTQLLQIVGGRIKRDLDVQFAELAGIWTSFCMITGTADFSHSSIGSSASTSSSVLMARFDGTHFGSDARFRQTQFPYETTFGGYSDMPSANFAGRVTFQESTFGSPSLGGRHLLQRMVFPRDLNFDGVVFYGRVSFALSQFDSILMLNDVQVKRGTDTSYVESGNTDLFPNVNLDLDKIRVPAGARLDSIKVDGSTVLNLAELSGEFECTNLDVSENLEVTGSTFRYLPLSFKAKSGRFTRCQFLAGGVISCSCQEIALIECDARQSLSIVSQAPDAQATIVSLERTNVENITLVGADLSRTIFTDAINLDKVDLQGRTTFSRAPRLLGEGREVIQDEVLYRTGLKRSRRWQQAYGSSFGSNLPSDPKVVAALYRFLRKNREDNKDEPGAADFYYGEMEMRRSGARLLSAEWSLLTLYWLISGYSLRAWRSFFAFLFVVWIGGTILHFKGYTDEHQLSQVDSVLAFTQVSLAIAKLPDDVTSLGSAVFILGRLLCPAFLALGVLALRGRVKR